MELEELKNIYDEKFWGPRRGNWNYSSAKIILPMIFKYYKPNSIIDVGCGIGTWLSAALELGIDNLKGLDCNEISEDFLLVPRKYISIDNLETHENKNNIKYDLAISVEVAEHLDNSASEHFIKMLTSYSKVIIFSAGIPYQEGEHHINCQQPQFWHDIFAKYEYICFDFRNELMNMWEKINPCYAQNILLYVHKDFIDIFKKHFSMTNKPIFYYHPHYVNQIVDANKNIIDYLISEKDTVINALNKQIDDLKTIIEKNNLLIEKIAWWIPIKSLRNSFRAKFKIEDQTRPDQTRPDQTRPDQTRPDQT